MNSINYISTIPEVYLSKRISIDVLNKSITYLRNSISGEYHKVNWRKEYPEQEIFVDGISTTTGKLHQVLPKFSYTINLKKKCMKSIVKRIACNAIILAQINDAYYNRLFTIEEYYLYYICLIIRRYSYKAYKDHISTDLTLNELLSNVVEYLYSRTSNDDLIEQVKKNSSRTSVEGDHLTTSEKKSIAVKQSKKRCQEEIDFIIELHKQKLVSRVIAVKYQDKFKKRISHMTVTRIIKENMHVKPEIYIQL